MSRRESAKGEPSIDVFGLDRPLLERGRRLAWVSLEALIPQYAVMVEDGEKERAGRIERTIREASFLGVLAFMVRIADGPSAEQLIDASCLRTLHARPEIRTWV